MHVTRTFCVWSGSKAKLGVVSKAARAGTQSKGVRDCAQLSCSAAALLQGGRRAGSGRALCSAAVASARAAAARVGGKGESARNELPDADLADVAFSRAQRASDSARVLLLHVRAYVLLHKLHKL